MTLARRHRFRGACPGAVGRSGPVGRRAVGRLVTGRLVTGRLVTGAFAVAVTCGLGTLAGCSSGGSHGVASDVRITACTRDADSHRAVVTGEVRNGTSKRSNYVVQVDVKANDSKIESGFASVFRVDPGARRLYTIHALGPDVPSGTTLTCTVSHVGRTRAA